MAEQLPCVNVPDREAPLNMHFRQSSSTEYTLHILGRAAGNLRGNILTSLLDQNSNHDQTFQTGQEVTVISPSDLDRRYLYSQSFQSGQEEKLKSDLSNWTRGKNIQTLQSGQEVKLLPDLPN